MQIKLLKINERIGTNYIEFVVGDKGIEPKPWQGDARILSTDVYNAIFWDSFVNEYGNKFDFAGPPTPFVGAELRIIIGLLCQNKKEIETVNGVNEFIQLVDKTEKFTKVLDYEKINWRDDWTVIVGQLKEVNQSLIEIAQYCLDNDKALWVLGI